MIFIKNSVVLHGVDLDRKQNLFVKHDASIWVIWSQGQMARLTNLLP